jgi:ribosomal subunit interface protein
VDIVVKGRSLEVPDHYRQHVSEKLAKIERYDQKLIRVDVELSHERNPRQSDFCQRVEITCVSRGPVIRAEARTADFYSALDLALAKIDNRLRRAADRRRVHRGRRAPVSVSAAMAPLAFQRPGPEAGSAATSAGSVSTATSVLDQQEQLTEEDTDQPWRIVRMKEHPGDPMTVDDALFNMELLGHDFFLFNDKESGRPSVVYRRKAYDYGVISLDTHHSDS